ncbi:MAG: NUDIX domain-containing protein [Lachnospiraceae bacterium]|nr:NUDIX domain-containing protein [Lachnospiraceae bacterium]
MRFAYCPYCGGKVTFREIGDEGQMPFCEACDRPLFDVMHTAIITLPVNEQGEAALLRQNYVTKDSYVCVAGYLKTGETAETAVLREVQEETGLTPERATYISSYYYEKNDLLMLGFLTHVSKREFVLSGEVDSAAWFPLEEALAQVREGSIAWQLIQACRAKLLEEKD